MKNDMFADIAAMGISDEGKDLIIPEPIPLEEKILKADTLDSKAVFIPEEKIKDRESLYQEVEREKEQYRPFFRNVAPILENSKKRTYLAEFQWRVETKEDLRDFAGILEGKGSWETVTIPHYGEPRGVATAYYRKVLTLTPVPEAKSLWLVFRGVDYKAHVYLNGRYIGSHEGFFAPFEFDISDYVRKGENVLLIAVENDYIHMGSTSELGGEMFTGDKFYAATGLGYDEPKEGWHHCPPGMGIYQDVYLESRSKLFVKDIFVRPFPKEEMAEVWLEIYDCQVEHRSIRVDLSVYGQNFEEIVTEHQIYNPQTYLKVGMGDSLTEAKMLAEGLLGKGIPLQMERGINYLKISVSMKNARIWDLDTPWLYQVQIRLLDENSHCLDTGFRQFGMREFSLKEDCVPKGEFLLNGRQIRLHGANSMGFEQQCVLKKDWDQLYTDLILAKVCRMNFIRLTQRPVQEEVYDYCDKIGLMLQTDLPAFGAIRRNQFAEGIRQVQEMEHLVRSHPSAILVTYINEPMPNAKNIPHRCLERPELEDFFTCADLVVRLCNPDRVIKHVDGDYDPPTKGFPDNHCYPCWYNGHGIDIGRLHKGYWMKVKDGWHYGCGEYGIEGMDAISVMEKYYPKDWLPQTKEEEYDWSPSKLAGSQTGNFHYFFYDTQHSLTDWVRESQNYQAEAVKMMTEAYRRDSRMNTFAYHLFIDAFPDGWTKTLMDVDRNPKKAYFAYRDALAPILVNLRTDRFKLFSGEEGRVECWICNDLDEVQKGSLHYQVFLGEKLLYAGKTAADIPACTSRFQGYITFPVPEVTKRENLRIEAALIGEKEEVRNSGRLDLDVFPKALPMKSRVCVVGEMDEDFLYFQEGMQWDSIDLSDVTGKDSILVTSYDAYEKLQKAILEKVKSGAVLLFLELPMGTYDIAGHSVKTKDCSMLPLHFASRATNHPLVKDEKPDMVRYWYEEETGYITPLLDTTFVCADCVPILTSANQDEEGNWQKVLAAGEFSYGKGHIRICQVKLKKRVRTNPTARILAFRLLGEQ